VVSEGEEGEEVAGVSVLPSAIVGLLVYSEIRIELSQFPCPDPISGIKEINS
jgi:hypothetical protein